MLPKLSLLKGAKARRAETTDRSRLKISGTIVKLHSTSAGGKVIRYKYRINITKMIRYGSQTKDVNSPSQILMADGAPVDRWATSAEANRGRPEAARICRDHRMKAIMMSATRRRLSSMSRRVRHDRLMSSVREYSGQYLTIVSGSAARVTIQGAYFVLLANTLSLMDFGLFAGISAAGIIIGSFAGLGFASAAFRTAATKSLLVGRYLAGLYVTVLISTPLCIACAYLLYQLAFAGRVALPTYLAIAVSDIVLWRLLEAVSQVNNGLGNFSQASADSSSDRVPGSSRRSFSSSRSRRWTRGR